MGYSPGQRRGPGKLLDFTPSGSRIIHVDKAGNQAKVAGGQNIEQGAPELTQK